MNYTDHWRKAVWSATRAELGPSEKLVALALSYYADFETGANCRPGVANLMARTSLTRRSVQRILDNLEDKGWIITTKQGGSSRDGKRTASTYQLGISPTGVTTTPVTGVTTTPVPEPTGVTTPTTGVMVATTGVTMTPYHLPPPDQPPTDVVDRSLSREELVELTRSLRSA